VNGNHEKTERDAFEQDLAASCAEKAEAGSLVEHVGAIVAPVRAAHVSAGKKSV
jgi:hypothetical protein